ncbi:hypothetical protein EYZ11_009287 [Aspergillus tanneri]|uniref:Asparagine synthetase domain-containing protein n=1 Tax=Aspergillus tanneri TaxID=1220188 RepID=A0A4S3JAF1_9EURO|nr:hypothetical protein EYZ11_009287 [Aspergillus tanneri]
MGPIYAVVNGELYGYEYYRTELEQEYDFKVFKNRLLVATEMKAFLSFAWKPQCDYPDKRVLETRSEAEVIEGVREYVTEAVRLRLRADVPVGVYLSGGLNSSSVAGIVAHLIKEEGAKLGTIAIRGISAESSMDIARRTVKWLGVEFHTVHMDEVALASRFEDAVWHSETPLPDVSGTGKLALVEKFIPWE